MKSTKSSELRQLATLLDARFELFGVRFGLDGVLGFVPVVGDLVTTGVSLYIIREGWLLGCSVPTLLRMGFNIMVENLMDLVPLVGNFFDIYWKANLKNLSLIERHLENPVAMQRQSVLWLVMIGLVLVAVLAGVSYLAFELLSWLLEQLKA